MITDYEMISDIPIVSWTLTYVYEHPELTEKQVDDLWKCCTESVRWMNRQTQKEFHKALQRLSETSKNREDNPV